MQIQVDRPVVLLGIFLPEINQSHFWFSTGPVTADFMVDRIYELWLKLHKQFPNVDKLAINVDNGPECSGQRTQWLNRLADFSDKTSLIIELAYYPPYHSKYNPVERLWGVLKNHWRGELLNSIEKALGLSRAMEYAGVAPTTVKLIRKIYRRGAWLTKNQMTRVEERIHKLKGLEKWFITISPQAGVG
jgi:hypothetical protein